MTNYTPSNHKAINQVRRQKDHARYDAEAINAILNNNMLAHVGFTLPPGTADEEDWPLVMPMCYGRIEDIVYIHGYLFQEQELYLFFVFSEISKVAAGN